MAEQVREKPTQVIHMQKIESILIAVDRSGYKDKIISYSVTLAKALGARITAIHILDRAALGVIGDLISYYRGGMVEEYEKAMRKQAEEFLTEVRLSLEKEGIKDSTEVITNVSSAAEGIIDYAKNGNVDIVVMGTKGLTGVEKFLLGGVASAVIQNAHCPVLAIR